MNTSKYEITVTDEHDNGRVFFKVFSDEIKIQQLPDEVVVITVPKALRHDALTIADNIEIKRLNAEIKRLEGVIKEQAS